MGPNNFNLNRHANTVCVRALCIQQISTTMPLIAGIFITLCQHHGGYNVLQHKRGQFYQPCDLVYQNWLNSPEISPLCKCSVFLSLHFILTLDCCYEQQNVHLESKKVPWIRMTDKYIQVENCALFVIELCWDCYT